MTKKPPPRLTPKQRMLAVAHVQYELTQMVGAALRVDTVKDDVTNNALLESTLLHVRSLIDFLIDRGKPADIKGSTFGDPPMLTSSESQHLRNVKLDLDQHLAHITLARTNNKVTWPHDGIVRTIVELMRRYHAGLRKGSPAEQSIGDALKQIDKQAPRFTRSTPLATIPSSSTTSTVVLSSSPADPLRLKCFP